MRYLNSILACLLVACGGGQPAQSPTGGSAEPGAPAAAETGAEPAGASEPAAATGSEPGDTTESTGTGEPGERAFKTADTHTAKDTHGVEGSKLEPTKTKAHVKFVVVDKDKGPIPGIVIALNDPDGNTYHTEATDAVGFAEVLVPAGKKYEVVYLSLGSKDIAATATVEDEPNLTLKLTLRYKGYRGVSSKDSKSAKFVLDGVHFDTGKAKIRPKSFPRLDNLVEYMEHNQSARIQISGHTDNVGDKKSNKLLSQKRAQAVKQYLTDKGIDGSRIEAVGYGDEQPIAPNDTSEGRQKNRRIEATEL